MDRSEISRALATAIAYKQCGKQAEAEVWASILIEQLECVGILTNEAKRLAANTLMLGRR
jgi:hypothetical protein